MVFHVDRELGLLVCLLACACPAPSTGSDGGGSSSIWIEEELPLQAVAANSSLWVVGTNTRDARQVGVVWIPDSGLRELAPIGPNGERWTTIPSAISESGCVAGSSTFPPAPVTGASFSWCPKSEFRVHEFSTAGGGWPAIFGLSEGEVPVLLGDLNGVAAAFSIQDSGIEVFYDERGERSASRARALTSGADQVLGEMLLNPSGALWSRETLRGRRAWNWRAILSVDAAHWWGECVHGGELTGCYSSPSENDLPVALPLTEGARWGEGRAFGRIVCGAQAMPGGMRATIWKDLRPMLLSSIVPNLTFEYGLCLAGTEDLLSFVCVGRRREVDGGSVSRTVLVRKVEVVQ